MRLRNVVVLAATAALVVACASATQGGKSGPGPAVTTLTLGTDDTPGLPGADAVEEFARLVQAKSGGTVRVQPKWNAAGPVTQWDQAVARLVTGGDLDMGLIPARAWDTEGITTMSALHAPFLVTSDYLVDRILADDALAAQLLGGLTKAGLTGLALLPDGLRHPFGVHGPLTSPADFAGKTFRAPHSDTAYALFRAFGAEPADLPGDAMGQAIAAKSLAGMESSYTWASSSLPASVAAANVTFFPKVNTLVIRSSVLAGLSERQRAAVTEAAASAAVWARSHRPSEIEAGRAFCSYGGAVVYAADGDIAALARAAQPVYATLEKDPQVKGMIERIRELKKNAPAAQIAIPCDGRKSTGTLAKSSAAAKFPEGVYRAEIPMQRFLDSKVHPAWARDNSGISTLTFTAGTWRHHVGGSPDSADCYGPYTATGGRVVLSFREVLCGTAGGDLFSAGWRLDGGELRFVDVEAGQPGEESLMYVLFGSEPWKKIG
ncbi:TRAP transporter substrate-binding protein DctP [Acrocarpospora sp. B8E8]|uniref:TRAP transporter substrate-binding protein n=1 Tax=Acrocarpospora sp. B8E8 TaxID=3153572 RepID=UPI00325CBE45